VKAKALLDLLEDSKYGDLGVKTVFDAAIKHLKDDYLKFMHQSEFDAALAIKKDLVEKKADVATKPTELATAFKQHLDAYKAIKNTPGTYSVYGAVLRQLLKDVYGDLKAENEKVLATEPTETTIGSDVSKVTAYYNAIALMKSYKESEYDLSSDANELFKDSLPKVEKYKKALDVAKKFMEDVSQTNIDAAVVTNKNIGAFIKTALTPVSGIVNANLKADKDVSNNELKKVHGFLFNVCNELKQNLLKKVTADLQTAATNQARQDLGKALKSEIDRLADLSNLTSKIDGTTTFFADSKQIIDDAAAYVVP